MKVRFHANFENLTVRVTHPSSLFATSEKGLKCQERGKNGIRYYRSHCAVSKFCSKSVVFDV